MANQNAAPKSEYKYEFVVAPPVEQTLEMERAAHRATCRVLHDAGKEIMRLRGLGRSCPPGCQIEHHVAETLRTKCIVAETA